MQGIEEFKRDGFHLAKGVLTAEQIHEAWQLIELLAPPTSQEEIKQGINRRVIFGAPYKHKIIGEIAIARPVVDFYKELWQSDEIVLLPDSTILRGGSADPHRDSLTMYSRGLKWTIDPELQFGQGIFYMQPNDPVIGGGLSVEPGSHIMGDDVSAWWSSKPKNPHMVPTGPGDCLLHHMNTMHWTTGKPLPSRAGLFNLYATEKWANLYLEYLIGHHGEVWLDWATPEFIEAGRQMGVKVIHG